MHSKRTFYKLLLTISLCKHVSFTRLVFIKQTRLKEAKNSFAFEPFYINKVSFQTQLQSSCLPYPLKFLIVYLRWFVSPRFVSPKGSLLQLGGTTTTTSLTFYLTKNSFRHFGGLSSLSMPFIIANMFNIYTISDIAFVSR